MKNKILSSLFVLFIIQFSIAGEVDLKTATKVAQTFFKTKINMTSNSPDIYLAQKFNSRILSDNTSEELTELPLFYIFNVSDNQGFIIVSGDDNISPILGYSEHGSYIKDEVPENVMKWLEEYKNQIRYALSINLQASQEVEKSWKRLRNGLPIYVSGNNRSVDPLINTTWDQGSYYNSLCPYDNNYNDRTVTGCVATAMAQVMKYWNWPAQGTGFHSYNHNNYGTLSANFGNTTYQWSSMPNNVTSQNTAVAH